MVATAMHELPHEQEAKQIAEERKADAIKHFNSIKKAGVTESTSSMRIGFNAYYLKNNNLFGILGFKSEEEARIAAGVGRSTWYDNMRLAEAFQGIDEESFVSMRQANAKALAELPESKRISQEWIRDAGRDSMVDFADKCDVALNGKAKASDGKERGTILKMPMPQSAKTVIEAGLKEYGERVGVEEGNIGKAMELMVAERTGQTSLIQSITDAVQRCKNIRSLSDSGLSADEILVKVYEEVDAMILEFADALNSVQNLDSETA